MSARRPATTVAVEIDLRSEIYISRERERELSPHRVLAVSRGRPRQSADVIEVIEEIEDAIAGHPTVRQQTTERRPWSNEAAARG